MMAALSELRDRFFVRQVVGQREGIHPRRHAILRSLVAELDDFLDHLALGLLESALFLANFDEGLEFFVAELFSFSQMERRQPFDDRRARPLEQASHAIEQRHRGLERENAERRETVRHGKREKFRNQIAKQNDDREDNRGRDQGRHARGQRCFPDQEETEDVDRDVRENVAEQENVENPARARAKDADEFFERWMLLLEAAELMGLEREERGLEPGKKRRPKDEDGDEKKKNGDGQRRHGRLRRRRRSDRSSRRLKRRRLPIIAGAVKLRPS